jgi:2-polyprenyl-3-methyl-5-hydroxy-6-metoxy-1,4-benzoquinol methylase
MHYYPSRYRLRRSVVFKAGGALACGPNVRRRLRFDYYLPYEIYECLIENQVGPGTDWLDVGGGKSVFPNNEHLANSLSRRCNSLIAVDPSENISKNPYADETHQLLLEEYETDRKFDLITARMVLEHVEQPVRFMQKAA